MLISKLALGYPSETAGCLERWLYGLPGPRVGHTGKRGPEKVARVNGRSAL